MDAGRRPPPASQPALKDAVQWKAAHPRGVVGKKGTWVRGEVRVTVVDPKAAKKAGVDPKEQVDLGAVATSASQVDVTVERRFGKGLKKKLEKGVNPFHRVNIGSINQSSPTVRQRAAKVGNAVKGFFVFIGKGIAKPFQGIAQAGRNRLAQMRERRDFQEFERCADDAFTGNQLTEKYPKGDELDKFLSKMMSYPDAVVSRDIKNAILEKVPAKDITDETLKAVLQKENGDMRDDAFKTVSYQVGKEIREEKGDALFRGTSVATKLLSFYMKAEGGEWTKSLLEGVHGKIVTKQKEVDETFSKDEMKKQFIGPLTERIKSQLDEKKSLSTEDVKLMLTQEPKPPGVSENIANLLIDPYRERGSIKSKESDSVNLPDLINLFNPLSKHLKSEALSSFSDKIAYEVLDRFEKSLKLDADAKHKIPVKILKMMKVIREAGQKNVDEREPGKLNAQQQTAFSGFDYTTTFLRCINPCLMVPKTFGIEVWDSTPTAAVKVSSQIQTHANYRENDTPELRKKGKTIQDMLTKRYEQIV